MNKAIIVGNLTRDPELKTLPSGIKVANFSIATNRVWYDDQKQKKEDVQFHNIVVFGKQAENTAIYLAKGSQCLVEGRLQTQSWDDQATGKKMYRTEIVAERVQFLGSKQSGESKPQPKPQEQQDNGGWGELDYPEEDINPEDIPFK